MPEVVFVQMRESGPDNVVTYEVIDKRRAREERIVKSFKREVDALKLRAKLLEE